jgi:enoyl-CoA hydratase/carnithine racemase
VLVFDSAAEEYFIARFDVQSLKSPGASRTGIASEWPAFILRPTNLPIVNIAEIDRIVRGHGNEISLACDMRFSSLEKGIFGPPEVGVGLTCGGGAMEWLSRGVGRSRALEILLTSDNLDAKTAELYSLINRAVPEVDLKHVVDNMASRILGFNRLLLETKATVNQRSGLLSEIGFAASLAIFFRALSWPERVIRAEFLGKLREHLGDKEFERSMPHYL